VDFTTGRVTSGTGWNIGGATYWHTDTTVNITGDSANIADQFLFGAVPRTVQFTGLEIDKTYKASFFSVGWDASGRVQTFSSEGDDLLLDQDYYGNNNGIVISYTYLANETSQNFTITPVLSTETFHLYALANAEVALEVDPTLPSVDAGPDMISWSGATVGLNPDVVNNDNEPQGTLTYLWTASPDVIGDPDLDVIITDAHTENASVTITKTPTGAATIVTMNLDVTLEGKDPVTNSMKIDVYDDACLATKAAGPVVIDETDIDGNCITNFKDFALFVLTWLDDYTLTGPILFPK